MRIRVIDFETTGMPDAEGGAAICEVGWCDVLVDATGTASIPTWSDAIGSQLCNPGRPIPPDAMAVHHIRDDEVANMPAPAEVLAQMAGADVDLFAAHCADFERAFFDPHTGWICTYKVALRIWPDLAHHNNQFLRYALPLTLADEAKAMPPHRAGADAWVTAHLLIAEIQSGKASIDDMVRWSSGPALLPRVNFGQKYKGAKWEDVPVDYLQWIVEKSDLSRDIKANAKYWLRKRFEQHDPSTGGVE